MQAARISGLEGSWLGPYQVVELLGRGGMAVVYKAFQPALRRHVALKILPPPSPSTPPSAPASSRKPRPSPASSTPTSSPSTTTASRGSCPTW